MVSAHVNGRVPSAWKGGESNFKRSHIGQTGSHGQNLYNMNIFSCARKQTLLHLDFLCLYVHVEGDF